MSKLATIHIFHHNDMDGIVAGSLFYNGLVILGEDPDSIITYEIDYTTNIGDRINLDVIESDWQFVFVDYSFSNMENAKILSKLLEHPKHPKVYWFDHHKSSLPIVELIKKTVVDEYHTIIIDQNRSGSMITYDYFQKTNHSFASGWWAGLKNMIKYVDQYDLFTFDRDDPEDKTREFSLGFSTLDISPMTFEETIGDLAPTADGSVKKIIELGEAIRKYLDIKNQKLIANNSFEFKICYKDREYKVLAANTRGNSLTFGSMINLYDMVCVFNTNGDQWTYSLYSNKDDVDCARICEMLGTYDDLGGGGHKSAAGFLTKDCIIYKNCIISINEQFLIGTPFIVILNGNDNKEKEVNIPEFVRS